MQYKLDLSGIEFTREQNRAIRAGPGRNIVFACPGAGKTAVLTERARRLVYSGKRILALTFTVKAAEEMKSRGVENAKTFHAYAYQLLKSRGHDFRIPDEGERRQILRAVRKRCEVTLSLKELATIIANVKKSYLRDGRYTNLVRAYQEELRNRGCYDFDDLILEANRELLRRAERYDHVLVDEYQDTSPIQQKLLDLLICDSLFVVSSPEQSIYAFRGAAPKASIDFARKADVYFLTTNFRSSEPVISASNSLIEKGVFRPKRVKGLSKEGEFRIAYRPDELDTEAERIADLLYKKAYEDVAILCRCNWQQLHFQRALSERGIPYMVDEDYFQRPEVKVMLAYLRLAIEFRNWEAFWLILRWGLWWYGRRTEMLLKEYEEKGASPIEALAEIQTDPYLKRGERDTVKRLHLLLFENLMNPRPIVVVDNVMSSGYKRKMMASDIREEPATELELSFHLFQEFAARYRTVEKLLLDVEKRIEKRILKGAEVQLLTIHKAKGLEFKTVIVPGLTQGIIPHIQGTSLDEERRTLYVAITRAKKRCILTRCNFRVFTKPSCFLHEIEGGER